MPATKPGCTMVKNKFRSSKDNIIKVINLDKEAVIKILSCALHPCEKIFYKAISSKSRLFLRSLMLDNVFIF